jgi:ADP-ribose pyrophosphatase YjhB (NUDIX family)
MDASPALDRKGAILADSALALESATMDRIWKPNVTVAALVERDGRVLLVEEETDDGIRFNQPAGHLDQGESLVDACAREALEETAWHFRPTALVGVYQWPRPQGDITYLRFAFAGELGEHEAGRQLDAGILRAVWMTPAEIEATRDRHRSPLILQCVQDWLAGRRFPLDLIRHYG